MNILEFLKNGSGIHIKEKNKGKFTKSAKAAGQSVQEHAKSVLNDPNATPLQKRRANFARNAAKWHHKNGGTIKAQGGTKFLSKQWFKNAGNDLKDLFQSEGMLDLGKSLFSGISDYKQTSSLLDGYQNKIAANADQQYEQALMDAEIERQKTPDMFTNTTGEVINQGVETIANGWQPFSQKVTAAKRKLDQQNAAADQQIRDAKGQALGNMFGTFVQNGLGTLTNILG